jgi:hypothetical protein
MVVIELVTGERVTVEGMTAEQVLSALDQAGRDRFAAFRLATGTEHINPAHVVRVSET